MTTGFAIIILTLGRPFLFEPPLSSKITDLAQIVRVKKSEKQAKVSCNGSKKQATSLL